MISSRVCRSVSRRKELLDQEHTTDGPSTDFAPGKPFILHTHIRLPRASNIVTTKRLCVRIGSEGEGQCHRYGRACGRARRIAPLRAETRSLTMSRYRFGHDKLSGGADGGQATAHRRERRRYVEVALASAVAPLTLHLQVHEQRLQ